MHRDKGPSCGESLDVAPAEPPASTTPSCRYPFLGSEPGDVLGTATEDEGSGNRGEPDLAVIRGALVGRLGMFRRRGNLLTSGTPSFAPLLHRRAIETWPATLAGTTRDLVEVLLDRAR